MPKQPVLYEAMYILDARIEEEQRQEAVETLEAHVRAQGGEVVATRDFGRRRLAYEIDGHLEGYYKVLYFTGFGDCVDEVKHEMRLLPQVVRGMVVVANPRFIHDPERQQQASEVAAEEEAEAEEFAEAFPEAAEEEADVAVAEEVTPAEEPPAETEVSAEAPVEEEG
ncbi:MAG: 30S ribosomal protein S6 [Armatimonadetes bacterium]|nr:30S ribosomal protein S6 [Armatimonadota bacterium]